METITDSLDFAILYFLFYAPIFYFAGCVLYSSLRSDDG